MIVAAFVAAVVGVLASDRSAVPTVTGTDGSLGYSVGGSAGSEVEALADIDSNVRCEFQVINLQVSNGQYKGLVRCPYE